MSLFLLMSLTACASKGPPQIIKVLPPAALMQPCPDDVLPLKVNGDLPKKIKELRGVIACERADKASLREWSRK